MHIKFQKNGGGYALETLEKSGVEGTAIEKPFVFITGSNGSGKSALMRSIRSSIGLKGEREGTSFHIRERDKFMASMPDEHPALLDLDALGWSNQKTYFFDSRATSAIAKASTFDDDDIFHHVSMIAGGGSRCSHGEFVGRDWWSALEWAIAKPEKGDAEKWLFLDEPETAIDSEKLIIGLAALIEAAEVGHLRVFCASHSLLFASGLADNEKVQTIDLDEGIGWLATAKLAVDLSGNPEKLADLGKSIVEKLNR